MPYKSIYYDCERIFLFVGNGLNQAFKQKDGWAKLLGRKFENVPYPLLFSLNNLNKKDLATELNQDVYSDDLSDFIRKLVKNGFTDFITTNYSYEIEYALLGEKHRNLSAIKSRTFNMVNRPITKGYLSSLYFETEYENKIIRVYHIHGECARPSSIILTQSDYAKSIEKSFENVGYTTVFKLENLGYSLNAFTYKTWIDFFVLNDIYFLGYGLSFYEFDVWTAIEKRFCLDRKLNKLLYFLSFNEELSKDSKEFFKHFGIEILPVFSHQKDEKKYSESYEYFLTLFSNINSKIGKETI